MTVARGWELPGPGGILERLCESHLSEMLRKELDHSLEEGPSNSSTL